MLVLEVKLTETTETGLSRADVFPVAEVPNKWQQALQSTT